MTVAVLAPSAGSEDGATPPAVVEALAAGISGARYRLIDGVGHIPCVEAPDTVATLISEFLTDVTTTGKDPQ